MQVNFKGVSMERQKRNYPNLRSFFLLFPLLLLITCQPHIPPQAMSLNSESIKLRQLQTRIFPIDDEIKVLKACSSLLQDLGFTIEENETKLGVLVASKDRSAVNVGNVILSMLSRQPWDKKQVMKASVTTKTIEDEKKRIAVRVTFQRMVWDIEGRVTRKEGLTKPKIYREFFDKLSKSLFLEAQEI
jgi:hypothetical protein